jgi:hypothetical protein
MHRLLCSGPPAFMRPVHAPALRKRARARAARRLVDLTRPLPPRGPRPAPAPAQASKGCNVEIHLPSADPKSHAELHWLKADGGLTSNLVTWRGQTYYGTSDGKMKGNRDIQNLAPSGVDNQGSLIFKVPVPPATAVLLVTSTKTVNGDDA